MARSDKLKWRTCIVINGVTRVIAESDGQGNVVRHMSEKEFQPYRDKMLKNIGEGLSRYMANHPESGLWK